MKESEGPHFIPPKSTADLTDAEITAKKKKLADDEKLRLRDGIEQIEDALGVTGESLTDLSNRAVVPLQFVIDDFMPVGFSILAGKPKSGKSWLSFQIVSAVASGVKLFPPYYQANKGFVLYIDFEETERLKRQRFEYFKGLPSENAMIYYSWRTGDPGLADLERWLEDPNTPNVSLVVIDTLGHFFPDLDWNGYSNTVSAFAMLKNLCSRHGASLLGVTHTRKSAASDFMDAVSGSVGLTATPETTFVVNKLRGQTTGTLDGAGREIMDVDISMELVENSGWVFRGKGAEYRASERHKAVLAALREIGEPITSSDLASIMGLDYGAVRKALSNMKGTGLVNNPKHSLWEAASRELYK